MSSLLTHLPEFTFAHLLHLILIFVVALVLNRLLRAATNLIVKPAASPTRAAQAREQQTRTLAGIVYSTGSKVVWAVALLTAAQEIGINVFPVAALAGLATLALGLGAQNFFRDIITGFHIILEDQLSLAIPSRLATRRAASSIFPCAAPLSAIRAAPW